MSMFKTYDHTKVNISFNGIALTDFNGDPTVSKEGPDFETVEGSNGAVERSRMAEAVQTLGDLATAQQIYYMQHGTFASGFDGLSDMGLYNPHEAHHMELECTTCHKAHRASVMYCTQCHAQAEVPEGWLSMGESNELTGVKVSE